MRHYVKKYNFFSTTYLLYMTVTIPYIPFFFYLLKEVIKYAYKWKVKVNLKRKVTFFLRLSYFKQVIAVVLKQMKDDSKTESSFTRLFCSWV